MKYKKGNTITIKTHEEMIADLDIKCIWDGNPSSRKHKRTYSHAEEEGELILMPGYTKNQFLGTEQKIIAVDKTGYELKNTACVQDWMIK